MNISNYFWYFQSVIPPRICDLIVQYGKAEKNREIMAITGGYGRDRDLNKQPLTKDEIKDLQKKRDSNIVWMNDRWIYKEIQPYVHQANKNAGWTRDRDWETIFESLFFCKSFISSLVRGCLSKFLSLPKPPVMAIISLFFSALPYCTIKSQILGGITD